MLHEEGSPRERGCRVGKTRSVRLTADGERGLRVTLTALLAGCLRR